MSFKILMPGTKPKVVQKGQQFLLVAKHNVYVEGLTACNIPHEAYLYAVKEHPVLIMPVRGIFFGRHLWIETTVLEDGVVSTNAFNMSDDKLMIKKGEAVSLLMCI